MSFTCTYFASMKATLSLRRRLIAFVAATFSVILLMIACYTVSSIDSTSLIPWSSSSTLYGPHRKLLLHRENEMEPNRYWGDTCSTDDIVINQGQTTPLPSGIPTYTVEIQNVCASGCNISGIHLSCKWFSSARLVNPHTFKRLKYDDCLVNDGKPLLIGRAIHFTYANTFSYPLTVSQFKCYK